MISENCLDGILEYLEKLDWDSEELYDSAGCKYFAVIVPKKPGFIESMAEWICGGKDAYNYESTKESLNHLPNILIYIYIQWDQNEPEPYNSPYIVNAIFDVACDAGLESTVFEDQFSQELSTRILESCKKRW